MASFIAREGYPFIIVTVLISIILYAASRILPAPWLTFTRSASLVVFVLALFMAYFFRDPERPLPCDHNALISPADGRVIDIRQVEEPLYVKTTVQRISIFMSVFDVHVNRSPIPGVVDFLHHHPGKFISAFKEKASLDNESMFVGIKDATASSRKIAVKLIAGLIARRIVFYKKLRDELGQGERIGMIRFGSRVEVYFPLSTEVKVKKGDTVTAGKTVLAIFKD